MTIKKYASKFKYKVVLEALKERESLAELAQNIRFLLSKLAYGNALFYQMVRMYLVPRPKVKRQKYKKKNRSFYALLASKK
jgi:transposase